MVGWKTCLPEEVEGERYRVGEVVDGAQTIFGEKNVRAKASIKGDEVVRWVSAKMGLEIQ